MVVFVIYCVFVFFEQSTLHNSVSFHFLVVSFLVLEEKLCFASV